MRNRVVRKRAGIRLLVIHIEFSSRRLVAKTLERHLDQIIDAVAVRGRNGVGFTQAKFMKLGNCAAVGHALGFVHAQKHALRRLAQQAGNIVIVRIEPRARVDQKQNDIGFRNGLSRLARHLVQDAGLGDRFESTGIDGDKGLIAHPALAVVAIAGQAGEVRHERRSRARQPVEQG